MTDFERWGIALDNEKMFGTNAAVEYYEMKKQEERKKNNSPRKELYKGQRLVHFLVALGIIGFVAIVIVLVYFIGTKIY